MPSSIGVKNVAERNLKNVKTLKTWKKFKTKTKKMFSDAGGRSTVGLQTGARTRPARRDSPVSLICLYSSYHLRLTIRYEMLFNVQMLFNVRSKADMSRLNLPHGNDK